MGYGRRRLFLKTDGTQIKKYKYKELIKEEPHAEAQGTQREEKEKKIKEKDKRRKKEILKNMLATKCR